MLGANTFPSTTAALPSANDSAVMNLCNLIASEINKIEGDKTPEKIQAAITSVQARLSGQAKAEIVRDLVATANLPAQAANSNKNMDAIFNGLLTMIKSKIVPMIFEYGKDLIKKRMEHAAPGSVEIAIELYGYCYTFVSESLLDLVKSNKDAILKLPGAIRENSSYAYSAIASRTPSLPFSLRRVKTAALLVPAAPAAAAAPDSPSKKRPFEKGDVSEVAPDAKVVAKEKP